MFDVLIKNGLIADGTGAPAFKGDLAVKDGVIAAVAPHLDGEAKEVLDAEGLVVAPGFIDNHSHSDDSVFSGSNSYNYLESGVTTQIAGQCGSSPAPYYEGAFASAERRLPAEEFRAMVETARTPGTFMKAAENQTFGTNMAFFIGHGALRGKAMGYSDAKATPEQMDIMKEALVNAMESGYLGLSSGLVYAPSVYGDTEELIELAKVMKPYGGIYASHIRGEGDHVLRSVQEAIRIGEEAGVRVLISHLKVMGLHNEGMSVKLLDEIDRANARGVEVYADQYPYMAGSAPMSSQIPAKYLVGGIPKLLERLESRELRQQMLYSIFHEADEFESNIYSAGFDNCLIAEADLTPQYVNKTIGQIAKDENKEPIDVLAELLIANKGTMQGIYFNQSPTDLIRIMRHPRVFCGSDWSDYPDEKVSYEQVGGGHPRATATMVRRLELVRDFRLRSLEESVKNLTYDTAKAMNLKNIGQLKEGWKADVCVFDYDRLHANADYSHPYRKSTGIQWVLVSGKVAVRDGEAVGVRGGSVLKRS